MTASTRLSAHASGSTLSRTKNCTRCARSFRRRSTTRKPIRVRRMTRTPTRARKYVYGAGMSRGANSHARERLRTVSTYREQPIPRSSRKSMHLGSKLIFVIRVGERMRTDITRYRLGSFSETRQTQLSDASSLRQAHTSMFEVPVESDPQDDEATITDLVAQMEELGERAELFVAYFNSDHHNVGQIFFAPARLEGRYLVFINPERLTYVKEASEAAAVVGRPQAAAGFADTARPATSVKRRKRELPPTENQ